MTGDRRVCRFADQLQPGDQLWGRQVATVEHGEGWTTPVVVTFTDGYTARLPKGTFLQRVIAADPNNTTARRVESSPGVERSDRLTVAPGA